MNMMRVIIGFMNMPPGQTYLATGHYYQDYFEYAQFIAQGTFGHHFIENQFTVFDPSKTLLGWGIYLGIGKIAGLLGLSPFLAYWIVVFLFSMIVCVIFFVIVNHILSPLPYLHRIIAFLFSIFATPFVKIVDDGLWTIIPYDFFYAPMSIFHRLGSVPHHGAATIGTGIGILLMSRIVNTMTNHGKRLFVPVILTLFVLSVLLTFNPLQVINLMTTFGIVCFFYFFHTRIKNTKKKQFVSVFVFMGLFLTCIAFLINTSHKSTEIFTRTVSWEIAQQQIVSWKMILLTLGPIVFLVPFGIKKYFSHITPIKFFIFFLPIVSYIYYVSPFAGYFGTFNQRFFTPYTFVLLAILAVYGIRTLQNFFPRFRIFTSIIILCYLVYFLFCTLSISRSLPSCDSFCYVPNSLVTGMKMLDTQKDDKAVLTSPSGSLGMILPIFTDRHVYLGRIIFTPNIEEKSYFSELFYRGNMTDTDARNLLKDNHIGYVIFSFREPYVRQNLEKYSFLKIFYENDQVILYKFVE
jgi:hypothetical protein